MMNRARKLLRRFPIGHVPLAITVLGAACLFEPTIAFAQSSSGGAFARSGTPCGDSCRGIRATTRATCSAAAIAC